MRFTSFEKNGLAGLAIQVGNEWRGMTAAQPGFPGLLQTLIEAGGTALADASKALAQAPALDLAATTLLPPLSNPEKIVCIGLNYRYHSAESGFKQPDYPTLFGRFATSLIGHKAPLIRPDLSDQLDYEGEIAADVLPGRGFMRTPGETACIHQITLPDK